MILDFFEILINILTKIFNQCLLNARNHKDNYNYMLKKYKYVYINITTYTK